MPFTVAGVNSQVFLPHVGFHMCVEIVVLCRLRVRRSVPAVRYRVNNTKVGEGATEIMAPQVKPFIRGRTPLVVERVRLEGKELEVPWRRPEKETIMVGDRYEGGGRETFQPAGAGTIYIQTITPEKGTWSC